MRERTTEANPPIEQEFLSVIREYERVIYKVCYLYANPNAPLNDLYQDVVLNLWKAYPKFRKECKVSTWIYRIALNTCISFYRKEKNVPEIVSLTKDTDWTIEAHDPINEMLKQLYQMINQLGQLDKSIILLYLEDKSYEEIAEITGLTVTNVATKLSRIKDKRNCRNQYWRPRHSDCIHGKPDKFQIYCKRKQESERVVFGNIHSLQYYIHDIHVNIVFFS